MNILALVHAHLVPPDNLKGLSEQDILPFKAEHDVTSTLRELGHDVTVVGLGADLSVIQTAMGAVKPDVVFNLIESFNNFRHFDQHVVAYLECLGLPYTGCNPRGLTLARDKALTKKILSHHHIRVPASRVFEYGKPVRLTKLPPMPLLVKSASDDGSIGISQASVVTTEEQLLERVRLIHEASKTHALAEQYIEGRELYVGVIGNASPKSLPVWELNLSQLPEAAPRIVTSRIKMDVAYQKKYNITSAPADLPADVQQRIRKIALRAYRALCLSGYARLDMRMTPSGDVYVLEANPNPQIARDEDFAASAAADGVDYPSLLKRIVSLGTSYEPVGLA